MDILWGHNKLPPGIKSLSESKSRKDIGQTSSHGSISP